MFVFFIMLLFLLYITIKIIRPNLFDKGEFINSCLRDKEQERLKCIALATDNVSICDTFMGRDGALDTHQRDNCRFRYFMTQAVLNGDLSYCENLSGDEIIICKLTTTYNSSFCSSLKDTPEEECIKFITKPIIPLENESLIYSDENSLNYYANIAIKEKKPELCELWPEYRKARKCKVIADPSLKTVDYCSKDVLDECEDMYHFETAKLSKSKDECGKIKFSHEKERCFELIS